MIKRIRNISLWVVFGVGLFLLMSFVGRRQDRLSMSADKLTLTIKQKGNNQFLNREVLKQSIQRNLGYNIDSVRLSEIDLNQLERHLKDLNEVLSVEVYKSIDGKLNLEITERTPIVRVMHQNGMSNYIDEDGAYMSLSNQHSSHLPVVTGHVNESEFTGSIVDIPYNSELLFPDIYKLAYFIYENEFWKAQIQEIYVNEHKEFELIPRVGDHRIILGKLDNMERKFKKLKIFYKEGLNNTGWNEFETINIKYKNQIVCS